MRDSATVQDEVHVPVICPYGVVRYRRRRVVALVAIIALLIVPTWFASRAWWRARADYSGRASRRDEIRYQVDTNLRYARSAISDQNWMNSQIAIDRARVAAGREPTLFRPAQTEQFESQIEQVEIELRAAQVIAIRAAPIETRRAIERSALSSRRTSP